MVRMVSEAVICRMAKPGKVNGSVGKKKDLINELLDAKTFLSISFYESGLQSQHAKCGRAQNVCVIISLSYQIRLTSV